MASDDVLRIANCSAFFGDRLSAATEMVRGGPIDVLTGDYLAELTMAILERQRMKDPKLGFAGTFVKQMADVLADCLDKKIRVVSNAGGLNPHGCRRAIEQLLAKLGRTARIAVVEGDDLLPMLDTLLTGGEEFLHLDRHRPLAPERARVVTANAYLGGWGVAEALRRDADIVITGRVTDAALVVGPAAWKFDWQRNDWDRLAGAVAAGHIIECGTQATGGNYSFFEEVQGWESMGFPLVEMHGDGSFVVTKHPGTGGLVSVGTVTAQLLYEIDAPRYLNPDVSARFDSLMLTELGPDRVGVRGARGEPPPERAKVCINLFGGYRNSMTVRIAGTEVERKARIVEETLWHTLGGRERFARAEAQLTRNDRPDPASNDEAVAHLKFSVFDGEAEKVGRAFSSRVIELATASVPGLSNLAPPSDAVPYFVYWPALLPWEKITERVVVFDGDREVARIDVGPPPRSTLTPELKNAIDLLQMSRKELVALVREELGEAAAPLSLPTTRRPFGDLYGTRSGDKGGNANLGVWAKNQDAFVFLESFLTVERLKELLPDLAVFAIDRYSLPNLFALNFVVHDLLGEGVASSTRNDPQAKTLGEYLRAKLVELPDSFFKTF